MRPKKHRTTGSNDLFRARLDQVINMKHELVQLAGRIDWDWIDGEVAPLFSENGPPGIETRFMIGLLLRPDYRIIRNIRRRIEDHPSLEEAFAPPAWPGHADPLATAAPAWLETLFHPCPGGGVHRQRQGWRALRVRRQGLNRHQQPPGSLPVACS